MALICCVWASQSPVSNRRPPFFQFAVGRFPIMCPIDWLRFFLVIVVGVVAFLLGPYRRLLNWAICATVRQNRKFWATSRPPQLVCPFTGKSFGKSHSVRYVASWSDEGGDGKLRVFTPFAPVFLAPPLLLACIVILSLFALSKLWYVSVLEPMLTSIYGILVRCM